MNKDFNFYVYIMSSNSGTIYIGFTNNLIRRVFEHKNNLIEGFTKSYSCHRLVYYEYFKYVNDAISREKEIKKWNRKKKIDLIKELNPHWNDLYDNI